MLGLIRLRFLAIVLPVVALVGAAIAFSLLQEKEYEASTSVLFRNAGFDPLASQDEARDLTTNLELLQGGPIRKRVNARLKKPFTGHVEVDEEGEAHLATVIVTDADPKQAARAANAYAEEYAEFRREVTLDELRNEREAVRAELAALSFTERAGPAGAALEHRLNQLAIAELAPSAVRPVSRAQPPSSPSSPKPVQNALIGALLGLALGIGLAIWLERRDRRVRDPRYIEYALGRPIIGRIPRSRALAKQGPGTAALPPSETEAFRTVRANLRRQLKDQDVRSLLVTSALPGEGKTTLVWNLARVEAASGTRVLLVEADMRRPVLSHSLGANGTAGLSELLAGDAQLQDLVRRVSFDDRTDQNGGPSPGALDVLFAGHPPANPAELLDSERMQAMLEIVPDSYDLVVLDTPPALVSDAMPILDHVGAVVVVGRLGLSTGESLTELREQLDRLEAPTLGVVVNADVWGAHPYYQHPRAI